MQLRERERALRLGAEVVRRESVLKTLEGKLREIEADHERWMNKHQTSTVAEQKAQQEMIAKETEHLYDLQRIEEEIALQRLRALSALEKATEEEMALIDKMAEESRSLHEQNEKHMKFKMEISLNLQKHREAVEKADVATHEKLHRLGSMRMREDVRTIVRLEILVLCIDLFYF